jgi:molybdate transport repressor ModE-like protein
MLTRGDPLASLSPYAQSQDGVPKRIPDWDDFRVLMTVIKMGSFNRAADALGLTQPTVSRRIAALEKVIGTRIVDRSTTGAQLTLEGQRIFDELNVAHTALERVLNNTAETQKDVVKLLITDGLAAYWLTHFLPMLYRLYPQLELRIFTANHSTAERHGQYDLSLHFILPTDPDTVAMRLGTLHFIPYGSARYIEERGRPSSLAEFAGHRLLDFMLYLVDAGSWITQIPDRASSDHIQLFTNSSVVLAESVRRGAGIALLPTYGSVFEEGFEPIETGLHFETPFWLCSRQDALDRKPVQIVQRFLRHVFDPKTMPWFADRYVHPREFQAASPRNIMDSFSQSVPCDEHGSVSVLPRKSNGRAMRT